MTGVLLFLLLFVFQYLLLPVECQQCYWQGPISSWTSNHNARRCRRIARHLRRIQPSTATSSTTPKTQGQSRREEDGEGRGGGRGEGESSTTATRSHVQGQSNTTESLPAGYHQPTHAERRQEEERQQRAAFFPPPAETDISPSSSSSSSSSSSAPQAQEDGRSGRSIEGGASSASTGPSSLHAKGEDEFAGDVDKEPSALHPSPGGGSIADGVMEGARRRREENESEEDEEKRKRMELRLKQQRVLSGERLSSSQDESGQRHEQQHQQDEDDGSPLSDEGGRIEGMEELIAFVEDHLPVFGGGEGRRERRRGEEEDEGSYPPSSSSSSGSGGSSFFSSYRHRRSSHRLSREKKVILGVCTRVCIISHRMENTAGALGGFFFGTGAFAHTQAVLEFRPQAGDAEEEQEQKEARRKRREEERRRAAHQKKGFLSFSRGQGRESHQEDRTTQEEQEEGSRGGLVSWFTSSMESLTGRGLSSASAGNEGSASIGGGVSTRDDKKPSTLSYSPSSSDEEDDDEESSTNRVCFLSLEWMGEGEKGRGRMDWQISRTFPPFKPSAIKMFVYCTEHADDVSCREDGTSSSSSSSSSSLLGGDDNPFKSDLDPWTSTSHRMRRPGRGSSGGEHTRDREEEEEELGAGGGSRSRFGSSLRLMSRGSTSRRDGGNTRSGSRRGMFSYGEAEGGLCSSYYRRRYLSRRGSGENDDAENSGGDTRGRRKAEDLQVVYLPGAVFFQLLMQIRKRPYRVLGWNCRDFCNLILNW